MAGLAGLLIFGKFALPSVFGAVAGARSRCGPPMILVMIRSDNFSDNQT